MAGWLGRSVYVDFIGCNAEHLSQEIKDMLFEKIKSFSRRPPVRAKVVLIENDNVTEEDQIGIVKVRDIYYFLCLLTDYLIVMDLHYVENGLIALLMEWNELVDLN